MILEQRADSGNPCPRPQHIYSPPASPLHKRHANGRGNSGSPQYLSPLPQPLPRAIQYLSVPGAFEDAHYDFSFKDGHRSVSPPSQRAGHRPASRRVGAMTDNKLGIEGVPERFTTPRPISGLFINKDHDQILPFERGVIEGDLVPRPSRPLFSSDQPAGRGKGKKNLVYSPTSNKNESTSKALGKEQYSKSDQQEEVLGKEKDTSNARGASSSKVVSRLPYHEPPARLASCPQLPLHPNFDRISSHSPIKTSPPYRGPALRHDTASPPSPVTFSHRQQTPHHQPRSPPPSLHHAKSPSPLPYHTWPSPNPTTPAPTPGPESMMFPTVPTVRDPIAQRTRLATPSSDFYDLSEYRASTPRFWKPEAPRLSVLSLRGGYHDPRTGGFARLGSRKVWWRDGRCVDTRRAAREGVEERRRRKRGYLRRFGKWAKRAVRVGDGPGLREPKNDDVMGRCEGDEEEGNDAGHEEHHEQPKVERTNKKITFWKKGGRKIKKMLARIKP